MIRWIATVVSLALVVGSMDAAMHAGASLGAGGSHELHGELHDPGEPVADAGGLEMPAPDGEAPADHYCHCAAHSPAMLVSFQWWLQPLVQPRTGFVPWRHAAGVHSPPLRPPNLV